MSELQENLNTIKSTIWDLKNAINEIAVSQNSDSPITDCTSFTEYPKILRSLTNVSNNNVITLMIYKISDIRPDTPDASNSKFDFDTNTYVIPDGWVKAEDLNSSDQDTVWMSQAIFAENIEGESNIVNKWCTPIKLSGIYSIVNEHPTQTVYYVTKESIQPSFYPKAGAGDEPLNEESIDFGWSTQFAGIDAEHQFAWISTRSLKNNQWSDYSEPVLYAHFGLDGSNGIDGRMSRTVFIFKTTPIEENLDIKDYPIGGYWNMIDNTIQYPIGWTGSVETTSDVQKIWMSTATLDSTNADNPTWSIPVCITGPTGLPGEDGATQEFIYALLPTLKDLDYFNDFCEAEGIRLSKHDPEQPTVFIKNEEFSTSLEVIRPDASTFTVYLTDSPSGISIDQKVEICWIAKYNKSSWSNWSNPILWSVWGEKGLDADGIEYVFSVSNDKYPDIPILSYEELSDSEKIKFQQQGYVPNGWFADASEIELGPAVPFLFCSVRKQYRNENGDQLWGDFSAPSLWGHWGLDGVGSFTAFAFCVSPFNLEQYQVKGGEYNEPYSNLITYDVLGQEVPNIIWSDTIPEIENTDSYIWMINRFFSNDTNADDYPWSKPIKLKDSENRFEVEYCDETYDGRDLLSLSDFKALKYPDVEISNLDLVPEWEVYVKENGYGNWTNIGTNATYMAISQYKEIVGETNKMWTDWSVNKIKGESGNSNQFIFKLTDGSTPENPTDISDANYQNDTYYPSTWSINPISTSDDYPVCWVSQRTKVNDRWGVYSNPARWSMYAAGQVRLELSEYNISVPITDDGLIESDYKDFIAIRMYLYDNATLKTEGIVYKAVINGNTDTVIQNVLSDNPLLDPKTGFYDNVLYITKDTLNNNHKDDNKLTIEITATYKNVPYARTSVISKSTSVYELWLSHACLPLTANGKFKDEYLKVQLFKWQGEMSVVQNAWIKCECTTYDNQTIIRDVSKIDTGGTEYINLSSLGTNIKTIRISCSLNEDPWNEVTWEEITTVLDGTSASFTSIVYTRSDVSLNAETYRPVGGTYDNPLPNSSSLTWSDGIPSGTTSVWMSSRKFYENDVIETVWSIPVNISDGSSSREIYWSNLETLPNVSPDKDTLNQYWQTNLDSSVSTTYIWQAERYKNYVGESAWGDWIYTRIKGEKGDKGDPGEQGIPGVSPVAQFTSYVFTWNHNAPSTPQGGSYESPNPENSNVWSDSITEKLSHNDSLWCSTRVFYSDNRESYWSEPKKLADQSNQYEFIYSTKEVYTPPQNDLDTDEELADWSKDPQPNSIWMGQRYWLGTKWSDWSIIRIKGEKGDNGNSISYIGNLETLPENAILGQVCNIGTVLYYYNGDSWMNMGDFQGQPGEATYVHIKYANENNTDYDFETIIDGNLVKLKLTSGDGESVGDYVGIFIDAILTDPLPDESERFANYDWKYWKGKDGFGYEYIYILTSTYTAPDLPDSVDEDGYIPVTDSNPDWTDNRSGISEDYPYEWEVYRIKQDGHWSNWIGSQTNPSKAALVSRWGQDGAGIVDVIEYYAKSASNTKAPEIGSDSWKTELIELDAVDRFLWNYEAVYIEGVSEPKLSTPQVIGIYSENGRGIQTIEEFYCAWSSNTDYPELDSDSWITGTAPTLDSTNKYLWNYEQITYTDETRQQTTPVVIGVYGDTGETGAMIRISTWSNIQVAAEEEDLFYKSGLNGEKWYDIVEHNGAKYRCIRSHNQSESLEPGTDGSDFHWIAADEYEFIATKLLLSEKIKAGQIDAEDLVVNKLSTQSENGTKVEIQDGLIEIFSTSNQTYANIRLGIDDMGVAVLQFYDNNNKLLFDLGASYGLRQFQSEITQRDWKKEYWHQLSTNAWENLTSELPTILSTLSSNIYAESITSQTEVVKRIDTTTVNGIMTPGTYNDYYFTEATEASTYYVSGVYCPTNITIYEISTYEFSPEEEALIETFNLRVADTPKWQIDLSLQKSDTLCHTQIWNVTSGIKSDPIDVFLWYPEKA